MGLSGSCLHPLTPSRTPYTGSGPHPTQHITPKVLTQPQLLLSGHSLLGAIFVLHLTNIYGLPAVYQALIKVLEFKQTNKPM